MDLVFGSYCDGFDGGGGVAVTNFYDCFSMGDLISSMTFYSLSTFSPISSSPLKTAIRFIVHVNFVACRGDVGQSSEGNGVF